MGLDEKEMFWVRNIRSSTGIPTTNRRTDATGGKEESVCKRLT